MIQIITTRNQSLQIDPFIIHLRLLARLTKNGDPNFSAIVNTINEIKGLAKEQSLPARMLYMLVKPHIQCPELPKLMTLMEEFIQMLIVNNLFNKLIGPPATLLCLNKLASERIVWPDHLTLAYSIRKNMEADIEHPIKARIHWQAGKPNDTLYNY